MNRRVTKEEKSLEAINSVMEGYRRILDSKGFGYYAGNYPQKEAYQQAAQRALSVIEEILNKERGGS